MKPGERFLRPDDLRRLQNFQMVAKHIVDGFYAGRHRSPRYDASAEFADYRPYAPGDEIRSLDWRAAARTDRDYVKLFRKETDMRCHIVLDCSASMAFRDAIPREPEPGKRSLFWKKAKRAQDGEASAPLVSNLSKFEYGAYLSAALCWMTLRQGDKAGLGLGGDRLQTFLPAGGAMPRLHRLLLALERAEPGGPTELGAVLRGVFAASSGRGLLIVISDFLGEPEPLFDALAQFAHRGEKILLFHVLTETELELPDYDGPTRYQDAESPAFADADPDALRSAYQTALHDWLTRLETQAKAQNIRYERFSTMTPYDRALERFLSTM